VSVNGGKIGLGLSAGLLATAIALLVAVEASGRCHAGSGGTIDLTPLLVLAVGVVALVLDVRAVRLGPPAARWGRLGLGLLVAAAVVFAWFLLVVLRGVLSCYN
jgi:hypothetical protein